MSEENITIVYDTDDSDTRRVYSQTRIKERSRRGHGPRASTVRTYLGASDLSITFFVIGYLAIITLHKSTNKKKII